MLLGVSINPERLYLAMALLLVQPYPRGLARSC